MRLACNCRKNLGFADPATLATVAAQILPGLLGPGVDTLKPQGPCNINMNSGDVVRINQADMPGLPRWRNSQNEPGYYQGRPGRTWGECARARLLLPNQITGAMGDVDRIDYQASYPDPLGVLYGTPNSSPSAVITPTQIQLATGETVNSVSVEPAFQGVISGVPNTYLFLGAVAALVLLLR